MATSPRRKFRAQIKAEAVQTVVQNNRPITQVAKELQINDGTLGSWVKLYRQENPEPEFELKPSDRVRLAELEAEVRELRTHGRAHSACTRSNVPGGIERVDWI